MAAIREGEDAYKEALEGFPKPGAKLRYRGTTQFWFANLIDNAERELRIGETYTLHSIKLALSWACINLEETGETKFSLGFFDELPASEQQSTSGGNSCE